jgi:hypothetical protein
MLFSFLNAEATAQKLIDASLTFRAEYPLEADALHYLKQEAVSRFAQSYKNAQSVAEIAAGTLQMDIWKNTGATFAAVCAPNPPQGEEWPLDFQIPHALYIDVNFWVSLPLE